MKKLKIVLISRIIYPLLSPRAFRATELAKEMAKRGHNVTLYAVLGKFDYLTFSKETGVIVKNIGNMRFATRDSVGDFRYNLFDKILYHALNRIIEFPDIELVFKIPKIIKKEKNCDLLITIAFPHPIHWGAALAKIKLSKDEFPKKWVSDCGDPYVGDTVNKKKYFYFNYIEKFWGSKTDNITIPVEEGRKGYFSEFNSKIEIIPQGFDFSSVKIDTSFVKNKIPTFAYAGSIIPGYRDPTIFMNYISTLKIDFRFIIFTNNQNFFSLYKNKLKDKLEVRDYIPRKSLIYELSRMDFLVNFKNSSSIQGPSKLIDYFLTKRPILEISNYFSEKDSFKRFLHQNYNDKLKDIDISQFDIKVVTDKFLKLYYDSKR